MVSGGASGVDSIAEHAATARGLNLRYRVRPHERVIQQEDDVPGGAGGMRPDLDELFETGEEWIRRLHHHANAADERKSKIEVVWKYIDPVDIVAEDHAVLFTSAVFDRLLRSRVREWGAPLSERYPAGAEANDPGQQSQEGLSARADYRSLAPGDVYLGPAGERPGSLAGRLMIGDD